jgi:hypothetical protein
MFSRSLGRRKACAGSGRIDRGGAVIDWQANR